MHINNNIIDFSNKLKEIADIKKIILFNQKNSISGYLSSFKLCLIVETIDKKMLEMRIYKNIESDIPFDIILYTNDEWNILSKEKGSFANKILNIGCEIVD